MRQTINNATGLAKLACFVRILRNTTETAMNLELTESSPDAFVIQGELRAVLEKIKDIDTATTLVTHTNMMS